ncbi:MAG: glycosyltransferase [Thermodesulfovibrionales bacterium]|nr:glycosyltransferase [Thermodesulfovibrionales bacterium]
MSECSRKLYLVSLAGLFLYGFTLPLSKSISSILMGLIFASTAGMIALNTKCRIDLSRALRQPLLLPVGLYIGVVCAGLLFSQDLQEGIGIVKQSANLFFVYLMVSVLLDTEQDEGKRDRYCRSLLGALLAGIFVLDVIGVLTYGGVIGHKKYVLPLMPLKMHHIWFGNLNAIGLYGVVALFFALPGKKTFIQNTALWLFVIISIVSVLLSTSRTAWLGMLFSGGVFLYFLVSRKRTFFLLFALILTAYVSAYFLSQLVHARIDQAYKDIVLFVAGDPATSLGARFAMWKAAISMLLSNPVFGVGTGDYKSMVNVFVASGEYPAIIGKYNQPHNMYLWILATNGIIGFSALVFLFFALVRQGKNRINGPQGERIFGLLALSVAVHYLVAGMTESLMNIHLLLCVFALMAGITVRKQRRMPDNDIDITRRDAGTATFRAPNHTDVQRMNILHVIATLPVGGVENTITRVIRGYQKEKFYPIICCIREGGLLAQELLREGYEVLVLNRMKSRRFDFAAILSLYKIIREKNVMIVRTHQYHANLYGRAAAILANVPCIVASVHNVYTRDKKLHRRLLNHSLSKFTDRIVAVSNAVKEDIVRYDTIGEEKITVIHNGIPLNEFNCPLSPARAREILNLPQELTLIGCVGRLVEQKGHRYLIEAASHIGKSCVVIAGDGPMRKELEALADERNVHAIFLGIIKPKTVPVFLRAIDIFCFPSIWEGFGIALVEAMSSGLPVVASDISPHREVLADAGLYVPSRDAEKLAQCLHLLMENPELQKSLIQKAQQRSKIFSLEHTAGSYEALYEEILMKKKNTGRENLHGERLAR